MIRGDSSRRKVEVCGIPSPGTFLCISAFTQEGQAETSKAKLAGGILGSSGFCCSFSFFLLPPEKHVFILLLIARWREKAH